MKQKSIWIGIVILLLVGGAVYSLKTEKKETTQIKIGALLPLTGKFANLGEDVRNGLELARNDIKAAKGIDFEIVYEDSGGDPKTATVSANKLVHFDKVALIIAGPGSSANLAVVPLLTRNTDDKVVFIAISSTPKLNTAGPHVIKAQHDIDVEARQMAEYMFGAGIRTAGVMFDSTSDTLITGKDVFSNAFLEKGGSVTAEGYEGKGVPDFKTQLTKLKAHKPDALYFLAVEKLAGPMVKQARELGLSQPVFGFSALESQDFLAGAGEFAEGVSFTALPFSCDGAARMRQFCEDYRSLHGGRSPLAYGAYGYDILSRIADAVSDGTLDKEKVIASFEGTEFDGVNGTLVFDREGNIEIPYFPLRTVKDGKFVEVK